MIPFGQSQKATFWMVLLCGLLCGSHAEELPGQSLTVSPDTINEMLRRRIDHLRIRVDELHAQINHLETRIPTLQDELARMLREAEALEVRVESEEVEIPSKEKLREVPFRPPLLRYVQKQTPLAIVCRGGRVAILDIDASDEALEKLMKDPDEIRKLRDGQRVRLPAGDFEIVLQVIAIGRFVQIIMEAEARDGQAGELPEEAFRPHSRLARRLARLNAEDSAIQFAVYPDSFEEFRRVRQLVWDRRFSVNWSPISHGDRLLIGSTSGGIGIQ